MFRFIERKIEDWLKRGKGALLVSGARQVGKTYSVRKVLERSGSSYFEINFYERPDILSALKDINDTADFVTKLETYSPKKLTKGESIIFFDEVQAFPELITKIKFLVDNNKYKYILSGSLLGVELINIKSVPVGYLSELRMYPMTLLEFYKAIGIKEKTIEYLSSCFASKKEVDEIIHNKLLDAFYYYLITGGMPAAIKEFIESRNLNSVHETQTNIIAQYKADFSKYEQVDRKLRIIAIYDNIPSQLNKQNMRFIFSYLNNQLKFDRYENSFLWLKEAGVVYPCYQVDEPRSPLSISKNKNNFKLFLNDVGLLVSQYPFFVKEKLLNGNKEHDVNNGSLFENFVVQELSANEFNPYYFKSTKVGEIDFLVETNQNILVIEVKSGKDYKKHKAIDNLKKVYSDKNYRYLVLSTSNLRNENEVLYLPIYMVGLIKKGEDANIDASALFKTIEEI